LEEVDFFSFVLKVGDVSLLNSWEPSVIESFDVAPFLFDLVVSCPEEGTLNEFSHTITGTASDLLNLIVSEEVRIGGTLSVLDSVIFLVA
jgi:hypothetical protein